MITDYDLEFIAEQIKQGYTSGRADNGDKQVAWDLNIEEIE